MKPESLVRILAGSLVLLGSLLAWILNPWWLLLTGFVGFNLVQSALTGFCPPTFVLERLGFIHTDGLIHLRRERRTDV
jgi:hypothetical protein